MDASKRDSGKWTDTPCLLLTFPKLFQLVVAYYIKISCHKTTHANCYYGAWPWWAVSISVLSLTLCLFYFHHTLLGFSLTDLGNPVSSPLPQFIRSSCSDTDCRVWKQVSGCIVTMERARMRREELKVALCQICVMII